MTDTSIATRPSGISELEGVVADALEQAAAGGATGAEAGISTSSGLSVTVRMGEVETVEHTQDRSLGLTVYFDQRKGSASTTDLAPGAVADTVRAACAIARYTAEDDCAGLADADLMATEVPDLELSHPWRLAPEGAIDIATETEQAARDLDPRITNSEGATVSRHAGDYVYGNSHGFLGGYSSTRHSISCAVIAEDGSGMERDYWYTVARDPAALEDGAAVGRRAAERSLRRLGARQITTRSAPVLYPADLARGLFHHLVSAVRGSNLYRKASFLVDALGTPVLPGHLRLHEQPHLPGALGSAAFDGEGVATRERDLVSEGVLRGYVLDSYAARKLGMQTTGNAGGVHNLTVEPGPLDFDGLLAQMDTGLLVTELLGMGINITTGDYSRGAAGYWVEGGEIRHPVSEITIAGNLRDIYRGIRAVGNDVDARGNIRTGSALVERMTIAGA